ncbi:MAG: hypothetical protein NT132_08990 [Microbacterium sp.]|uniref:hypothetical protein n=1 Tax=Microbacterium sp. TaxID=51671 RepID=UPI00261A55B9|nr:hypothetical protein [Microbacterium sp.]MCX6502520.1 hypothetical protein [Microbacterium sp.]
MGTVTERRRVAIVDGATRHDLSLPFDVTLTDALTSIGIRPHVGREVLVEPDGREVSTLMRAEDLEDGAVLAFVDLTPGPPRRRGGLRGRADRSDAAAAWWTVLAVAALLAGVSLLAPEVLPPVAHTWLAVIAAVGSLAAGLQYVLRASADRSGATPTLVALLALAFAAGATAVPALPAAADVLGVFAGLLTAAVIAGVLGLIARPAGLHAALTASTTLLLVLAGVWGLTLLLGLPAASAAAVTVGLTPVALRALLSTLMEVPPGLFIDYARYQSTRWSVRQQLPAEVHGIGAADARRLVARSTGRLVAGTVVLCVATALSIPAALPGLDGSDPLVLAGRIALVITTVLALLLGARRFSTPLLRWLPRSTAAVILLVVAFAAVRVGDAGGLTLAAGVCLVAGAAVAFAVVPAGRGARSLFWSRLGDAFEWIAIALSLPAALLAADAVDVLRGMMAA